MVRRKLMFLSTVGLFGLTLTACNSGSVGSSTPASGTAPVVQVDVGSQLYIAEKAEVFLGFEIYDEIDLVAASGETGGKSRPHAFRAAADQRMRVEHQSAGRHGSNRAQSSNINVVGDRRRLWKRAS